MESRSLPQAIRAILQAHVWSQAWLAPELGVTPDWVSKVKRIDRDPAFNRVIDLRAGMGCGGAGCASLVTRSVR